jgi:hypothetical protein
MRLDPSVRTSGNLTGPFWEAEILPLRPGTGSKRLVFLVIWEMSVTIGFEIQVT